MRYEVTASRELAIKAMYKDFYLTDAENHGSLIKTSCRVVK
jgi:hypothetical protein